MADCVLCGGRNDFTENNITDPIESFKCTMMTGHTWNPHESMQRCCSVVCETCCRGFANKTSQCSFCRQRLNLWVVVNVLGTEGGGNE